MKVSEKRVLTKAFVPKREKVMGGWKKCIIVRFIFPLCSKCYYDHKIKDNEMGRHVPHMRERRNAYRILIGQPRWRRHLGRPWYR